MLTHTVVHKTYVKNKVHNECLQIAQRSANTWLCIEIKHSVLTTFKTTKSANFLPEIHDVCLIVIKHAVQRY